MTDLEKTIKGMESLHTRLLDAATRDSILMLDAIIVSDALDLLKAQEPKPPIIVNGRWFQIKKCPKCYMTIKADEKPNFCSNCGQEVKWE